MRQKVNLILLMLFQFSLQSQNLIKNGGFEELEMDTVRDWQFISGTPDIVNLNDIKKDYIWETNKRFFKGVKNKGFVGYAFSHNSTEVLSTKLKSPLIRDSTYKIKISFLAGHSCRIGLSNITIGLTKEELEKSEHPKSYQINIAQLTNKSNKIEGGRWNELELNYQSIGGEMYLSLGNFNGENYDYMKHGKELMIAGELENSCSYLIIDEIKLTKTTNELPHQQPMPEAPIVIEDIAFDFGEWEIKEEYHDELIRKIERIKVREDKFTIIGYTDNVGSEKENQILSQKRARAIMGFLVNKGVDVNRIKVIGKGEQSPKYTNETEIGRAKNRRVEIQFE